MDLNRYETVKDAAARLGVTQRAIQKRAADGRIPGAVRHGRSWMIPSDAALTAETNERAAAPAGTGENDGNGRRRCAMPLMNADYAPGGAARYIEAIPDPDYRDIAYGELKFFSGLSAEAAEIMAAHLNDADPAVRFSAKTVAAFANLSGGSPAFVTSVLGDLREQTGLLFRNAAEGAAEGAADGGPDDGTRALIVFFATMSSVLFHISLPDVPPLADHMKYLPEGLKVYSCYILAHKAYLEKDYRGALAIADTGLAFSSAIYPVGFIYCHIIASIALINLRQKKQALERLGKAWELAEPDGLIEPFGEHHGLLHGLIEIFFADRDPDLRKRIDRITYAFSASWRIIHSQYIRHDVADILTTLEFSIAMLYSRGWTAAEIGEHLHISSRTVYNRITGIFNKLGIGSKEELAAHMLF